MGLRRGNSSDNPEALNFFPGNAPTVCFTCGEPFQNDEEIVYWHGYAPDTAPGWVLDLHPACALHLGSALIGDARVSTWLHSPQNQRVRIYAERLRESDHRERAAEERNA